MDVVVSRLVDRLNRAIETSNVGLSPEQAEQLRGAARRSVLALSHLQAKLTRQEGPDVDLTQMERWAFPELGELEASSLLSELDNIIASVEREVLAPAENELSSEELAELKRAVGQVWGWIVCDLQDPIWKQYPDMAPSSR